MPCLCGKPDHDELKGVGYHTGLVRHCWLYANSSAHRTAMDAQPVQMPGLVQQAVNFGKAVVQHVATGAKAASTDLVAERLAICGGCPHLTKERRCAHARCGCFVDKKVTWESEKCPVAKW